LPPEENNGRQDIVNWIDSLLKPGVPRPEIKYDTDLIEEFSGDAQALYHDLDKSIYLREGTTLDQSLQDLLGHELLHYLDDYAVPDVSPDEASYYTGQEFPNIDPETRQNMTIFGLGKILGDSGMYSTPGWGYDYARTLSNPQEHLAYYTEPSRGRYAENIAKRAAKRIVNDRPESIEYHTQQPTFLGIPIPWAEPDTIGWTVTPERKSSMDVTDLVKYAEDREAVFGIYDELMSNYMTDVASDHYYQR